MIDIAILESKGQEEFHSVDEYGGLLIQQDKTTEEKPSMSLYC